jgi:predicted PurR-regulated permease PerM
MVSVIRGALIVAILQGIMAGLGFLIFGVPNPAFWGMIVVVASLIPIVGTWLIIIPAIIYLFATGHVFGAFGFLIWSGVIVNVIYNIVSPQLMRRGTGIHPYIILLGVLGGIAFFGPIGFLLGPFIVALLFSLLNMYPSLVGKTTSKKQRS